MIKLSFTYVDNTQKVRYSETSQTFATLKEAKDHLKEEFGKNTRQKMFIDTSQKKAMHCGYIFKRWNIYDDTQKRYSEHIWVTFYEVTLLDLDIKGNLE